MGQGGRTLSFSLNWSLGTWALISFAFYRDLGETDSEYPHMCLCICACACLHRNGVWEGPREHSHPCTVICDLLIPNIVLQKVSNTAKLKHFPMNPCQSPFRVTRAIPILQPKLQAGGESKGQPTRGLHQHSSVVSMGKSI